MTVRASTTALLMVAHVLLSAPDPGAADGLEPPRWDEETVELFARLPIQDGGRVKPVSTFAGFTLLRLNGRRVCRTPEGRRIGPTEWLMDCLLLPEQAERYRIFLVSDSAVLDAVGVSHAGRKKRDRYAYAELVPGRDRLMELAHQYMRTPRGRLGPLETQILHLAQNLLDFEHLTHHFDFARYPYSLPEDGPLAGLIPEPRFSAISRHARLLRTAAVALERIAGGVEQQMLPEDPVKLQNLPGALFGLDEETRRKTRDALHVLLHELDVMSARAQALAVFPPPDAEAEWLTPGDLFARALFADRIPDPMFDHLALYEELAVLANQPEAFQQALRRFLDAVRARAETRGEYASVPLEVAFYKARFFYWSLVLYVFCFLLAAAAWMRPGSRALSSVAFVAPTAPTALLVAGIVMRCIIRGRPPVTTLYETILFATAVAVVVALVAEWIDRKKVALSVGVLLGAAGLFLAFKYEAKEGTDTMPSLVAVLDTNFWLATHVTTIAMGYGAGLLAGALAHVYIAARLFRVGGRTSSGFYNSITGTVYGVICFALVFSVLGTVLGGIWAAESWGRFWGWDPKENGALLIVLWLLVILHARKGGYIREHGLHLAAVFNGIIVAFSWWGVNQLGVGLHSYGQISGVMRALLVFYAVEFGVIIMGGLVWLRDKGAKPDHVSGRVPRVSRVS